MSTRAALQSAIDAGEVLLVKYHGGSKPGESRQLSPIGFVGDDKVRAHCHASGRNKVFLVGKIEVLEDVDHSTATYQDAPVAVASEPASLAEAFGDRLKLLRAAGWHVNQDANYCSLHRYFKNGKPRATPALRMEYREFVPDLSDDSHVSIDISIKESSLHVEAESDIEDWSENEDVKLKPNSKPWYIRCEDTGHSSSFKSLSTTKERFLEWAARLDPVGPGER